MHIKDRRVWPWHMHGSGRSPLPNHQWVLMRNAEGGWSVRLFGWLFFTSDQREERVRNA